MVQKIKVIYVASGDPDFGTLEDTAILLSEGMVLDNKYDENEALIYIIEETIKPCETLTIDRSTCKRFYINFFGRYDDVDFEFLAKCSFVELVRHFAK
ncbi:hypothetical protein AABM38_10060 [Heyndrickxia sp. MSNUG]|uniref:hypothetical protein n=1 Tax=Heyndrickxia sp. MSNUG TaxID=3136677 RepID=UPI003C2CD3D5